MRNIYNEFPWSELSIEMSVDKFGRHEDYVLRKRSKNLSYEDSHIIQKDLKNQLLRNVNEPRSNSDAVNLGYVKKFCLTKQGNPSNGVFDFFDASHSKITNLSDGVNESDAVNVRTLNREVNKIKDEVDKMMKEQQQQYTSLSAALFQHVHRKSGRSPNDLPV